MNGYLLDTHVWLWMLTRPERLSPAARDLLEDRSQVLYLSAASTWEMAIKYRLGKLPLPEPPREFVASRLWRDGVRPLPIDHRHSVEVAELADHHSDPFDRLLIAQAMVEGLTVITADPQFRPYSVPTIMT